jgi:hypothetical protein
MSAVPHLRPFRMCCNSEPQTFTSCSTTGKGASFKASTETYAILKFFDDLETCRQEEHSLVFPRRKYWETHTVMRPLCRRPAAFTAKSSSGSSATTRKCLTGLGLKLASYRDDHVGVDRTGSDHTTQICKFLNQSQLPHFFTQGSSSNGGRRPPPLDAEHSI